MINKSTRLDDFFDPYNPEHMKAYEVLCNTGAWPKEFIASNFEIPHLCIPNIQAKMAQAWLHFSKILDIINNENSRSRD